MQLTQPTEPQFHRGIWAWDAANDTWVQLQIDTTNGSLHVAVKESVLPTGAAEEDTLKTRFGYSDTVQEILSHTKSGAGNYNLDFTVVPANTIHVITNIAAIASTTNPPAFHFYLRHNGDSHAIATHLNATQWTYYATQGWWVVKATDRIRVSFSNCLDGDYIEAAITGFAMDLPT